MFHDYFLQERSQINRDVIKDEIDGSSFLVIIVKVKCNEFQCWALWAYLWLLNAQCEETVMRPDIEK